ncbi:nucleoside-diphosphate kinase [Lacticaseibacillus sp. GG6-2]
MPDQRTLILVKPDGVASGHIGDVIARLERRRFTITALKVVNASKEQLAQHYAKLVGKPYYPAVEKFMMSGPMVAIVATGVDVVESFRKMTGPTNPEDALPGTIRGDYGRAWDADAIYNVVHSSDSVESAEKEIKVWFPEL